MSEELSATPAVAASAAVVSAQRLLARLRAKPSAELALVDRLRRLPSDRRRDILRQFTPRQIAAIAFEWRRFWARPDQLPPPGAWVYWGLIGGRGSGKTMTAAQFFRERVRTRQAKRVHLIAATPEDARETMIDGPSGIRTISPPGERPEFFPSLGGGGILEWPNGIRGRVFSAESPEHLRGPQCSDLWCDDVAAWGPKAAETWKQAMQGFRLGARGLKCVLSTTPIASPLLVSLIRDGRPGMVITMSESDDNQANLSADWFAQVLGEFSGTAFEDQERRGVLIVEPEGALFRESWVQRLAELPPFKRIVVAVDPSDAETERSDDTGIVVIGLTYEDRLVVIADLTGPHSAERWAKLAVGAYVNFEADAIVCETNRARGLVKRNIAIEAPGVRVIEVTAARGKATRAEPLSHRYQIGHVSHWTKGPGIRTRLHRPPRAQAWRPESLEEEMFAWVPGKGRSPNGVDALVWGAFELLPEAPGWAPSATGAAELPAADLAMRYAPPPTEGQLETWRERRRRKQERKEKEYLITAMPNDDQHF